MLFLRPAGFSFAALKLDEICVPALWEYQDPPWVGRAADKGFFYMALSIIVSVVCSPGQMRKFCFRR